MPTVTDAPTRTTGGNDYPILVRLPHLAVTPPRHDARMLLGAAAGDGQKVDT